MASLADAIPLDSQPSKKRFTNPPAFPEPDNDANGGTISMNSIQYQDPTEMNNEEFVEM